MAENDTDAGKVETGPARGCPRWVKIALIASVVVNCLAIGGVGGFLMKPRERAAFEDRVAARLARGLPEERAALARDIFGEDRTGLYEARRGMAAADLKVIGALEAEEFSSDRLREALADRQTANGARRDWMQDRMTRFFGALTPAERGVIAERMQRRLDRQARRAQRP